MTTRNGNGAKFRPSDLAMLFVVLAWGVNLTVLKIGLRGLPPHAFNAVRLTLASLAYLAILALTPSGFRPAKGDLWKMAGLGLLGLTAYQVFFIKAISVMNASAAAVVMGTSPVFIALLSTAVGQEKIHWAGWVGIALSFAGFFLVVSGENGGGGFTWQGARGAVLILLANACWAGYTVFARPVLERNRPFQVSALATVLGTAVYLPFSLRELSRLDWGSITPLGWGAIAYSGLVAITLCFALWYVSLKAVGSAKTGVYGNLTPIVAVVFAAIVLGDRLTSLQALGAAVTLAGVYLTRSGYRFFVRDRSGL
jgi:drug/metabolite transporter (DMT)-like permease